MLNVITSSWADSKLWNETDATAGFIVSVGQICCSQKYTFGLPADGVFSVIVCMVNGNLCILQLKANNWRLS